MAVSLRWDASLGPDVQGYRVKWGFIKGGPYDHNVEVGMAVSTTIDEPWPMGTPVYFTAYAYNTAGLESLPSNEVVYNVPIPTPTPSPTPTPVPPPTPAPTPAPPSNLQLLLDAIAAWWRSRFGGA
jgi:hypothetical protein